MKRLLLALCLAGCAPSAPNVRRAEPVDDPNVVRVGADATMGDLLAALRAWLREHGHEGECFLAWDAQGERRVTVRIGDREKSAAFSCGDGLTGLTASLEGRCPFLHFLWLSSSQLRSEAMTSYFAPVGRAYAARAFGAGSVAMNAEEAVLRGGPEGTVRVLAVPVALPESGGRGQPRQMSPRAPEDNPLTDRAIMSVVTRTVSEVRQCNAERDGSLVLEWQVEPDGSTSHVHPVTSTVSQTAAACAIAAVSDARFPSHSGDEAIDFCVPVLLDPALRPTSPERAASAE